MKQIFKVVSQSEVIKVPSQKSETGHIYKSIIVLQEIGGKYGNTFVAALLGQSAQIKFYENDIVTAALHFSVHEHNGQTYQDVVVDEIIKLNSIVKH
jgi:hypothetical protein